VTEPLRLRRAARVILLDPDDRVLLMRYDGVEAMHATDRIAAWRWWTLAELETTDEEIWPAGLLNIVKQSA